MAVVVTGARAVVKLSGEVFAFATGVSVNHESRLEEIPQLDRLEVAEYADNGHRCTITVASIKIAPGSGLPGNSARDFYLESETDLKAALLQPEIMIEIVQEDEDAQGNPVDQLIYIGHGAKFAGGSGQLDAKGVWQGSWSFNCKWGVGI